MLLVQPVKLESRHTPSLVSLTRSLKLSVTLWTTPVGCFSPQERKSLALALQSRVSEVFHVDIHPAAVIGSGLLMDHATGIVIGETAKVR